MDMYLYLEEWTYGSTVGRLRAMAPQRLRWSRIAVGVVFLLLGIALCINVISALTTHALGNVLSNRLFLGYALRCLTGMALAGAWYSMLGGENLRSVLPVFFGTVSFLGALGRILSLAAALVTGTPLDFYYHILAPLIMLVLAYFLTFTRGKRETTSESDGNHVGESPVTPVLSQQEAVSQLEAKLKNPLCVWDRETEELAITAVKRVFESGKPEKEVQGWLEGIGISRRGVKALMKSSRR